MSTFNASCSGVPPPHWPTFFGHFYQNSNKTKFGHVSAVLPHPQNPLLGQSLASKPPPLAISGYARATIRYSGGQGRSQKWPKEGVLRPEIVKGGGFEGASAEALRMRARNSFC